MARSGETGVFYPLPLPFRTLLRASCTLLGEKAPEGDYPPPKNAGFAGPHSREGEKCPQKPPKHPPGGRQGAGARRARLGGKPPARSEVELVRGLCRRAPRRPPAPAPSRGSSHTLPPPHNRGAQSKLSNARAENRHAPLTQSKRSLFQMKKSKSNSRRSPANYAPTLDKEASILRKRLIDEYSINDQAGLLLLDTALEAFSRMRAAQKLIAQHGELLADRFGQLQRNPAVGIERDSRVAMLQALRALNLDLEPLHKTAGRPPSHPGVTDHAD